jgi:hypothetical protein
MVSIVTYSLMVTVLILLITPQYRYTRVTNSWGICVQSFRTAYQNSKSLNFVFLVYRAAESTAANLFIITLTSISLRKIAQRPKIVTMSKINRDRYISITMLVISTCFIFCYSPFVLYISFTIFPEVVSRKVELALGQTVLTLLELTSFTNPFVYLIRNNHVKKQFWLVLRSKVEQFSRRMQSLRGCSGNTSSTQDTNCVILDNRSITDNNLSNVSAAVNSDPASCNTIQELKN